MQSKATLIVATLGLTLAGAVIWEGGPDVVVFPPQRIPLYFPHDYHVRKPDPAAKVDGEGLACGFCHEKVGSSSTSAGRDIPGHDTCEGCHDDWIGTAEAPAPIHLCARCHRDLSAKITFSSNAAAGPPPRPELLTIPPPNLRFPHSAHTAAKVACTTCHGDVAKKTLATRDDYPTMDRCLACHDARGVSTECGTCHPTLPSGRLITDFPAGQLKPQRLHGFAIHDTDFLRDHAVPAKRDQAYCASCHGQDFCLTCHDGVARDVRYHPGEWLGVHALKAKQDEWRCESCHRTQSFCFDCHVRSGVATLGTAADPFIRRTIRGALDGAGTYSPRGPHPMREDGWLMPTSKNFHGFLAQRNIRTCASCHQEQFCASCHASSRVANPPANSRYQRGNNPHGGANAQALRGSAASQHVARMCLKCHSPFDSTWR